jgi:hypothetical protein
MLFLVLLLALVFLPLSFPALPPIHGGFWGAVTLNHMRKSMLNSVLHPLEVSPNNRAGCHEAGCKKDAVKILKGEIRFGSWVEIKEHGSWSWKHWCATLNVNFYSLDS